LRFLQFLSERGTFPSNLKLDAVQAFERQLAARCQALDPARTTRSTVKSWNAARKLVPGWPSITLSRRENTRTETLAFSDYPCFFGEQAEEFLQDLARSSSGGPGLRGRNPYRASVDPGPRNGARKRRRKQARPATTKTRRYQILQLAAGQVRTGRDPASITSLSCLVDSVDTVQAIADYHWERTGGKPSSNLAGMLDVMRQVAWFQKASDAIIAEITQL